VWPINLWRVAPKNVRDVGAVEAFTFHDIRFHPNHFLGGAKLHRQTQQLFVEGALKPRIIDFAQSVTGAKNQINDVSHACGLCQPMWECQFRFVSGASQRTERSFHMIWPNIEIEVFRSTRNTCVHFHHIRAADQERNFRGVQCSH
jgi:hypothetical protein